MKYSRARDKEKTEMYLCRCSIERTDQVVFVLTSVATSLKSTTCFSLSNQSIREKGTQITPHCQDLEYSQTLERFLTLDILAIKNRLKSYLEEMMRKKAFVFAKT